MTTATVVPIRRMELRVAPHSWRFADEKRAEIDEYFAKLKRSKPTLWNGRVLLMDEYAIADGVLRGRFFETNYASFLTWREAWREQRPVDPAVVNCFGAAALEAADGGFMLGVMGAHTAAAGSTYFPSGTPEPGDVADGVVDMIGNVRRELAEETGIDMAALPDDAPWYAVAAGRHLALIARLQMADRAEALRVRILGHLAKDPQPELSDIRIVRSPVDFDRSMPAFVTAFLSHMWQQR